MKSRRHGHRRTYSRVNSVLEESTKRILFATRKRKNALKDLITGKVKGIERLFEEDSSVTAKDLVYLINHKSTAKNIKHLAYLHLVKLGTLKQLKSCAKAMDFSYCNEDGKNAVMIAIESGRTDVLRLFVNDFHLELDVKDEVGYGPAMQAANAGNWKMFSNLLKPKKEGGFGWQIEPEVLKNFPYTPHASWLHPQPYVITAFTGGLHSQESVAVVNTHTESAVVYDKADKLGNGRYGMVYRYKNGDQFIAVKYPIEGWFADYPDALQSISSAHREYEFLCKSYPDQGPYALQEARKKSVDETHYSYRMVMPFIEGLSFIDAIEGCRNNKQMVVIILRVAEELLRLHDRGVVHGDIRSPNMIIKKIKANDFNVRFIDFGLAYSVGEVAVTMLDGSGEQYIAPERVEKNALAHPSQDVYSLAVLFKKALKYWKSVRVDYPVISEFIRSGLDANPLRRMQLAGFIQDLKESLVYKRRGRLFDSDSSEDSREDFLAGSFNFKVSK